MSHTPGPWRHESDAGGDWSYSIICHEGSEWPVCRDVGSDADARLIAAAPDLLAALEMVFNHPASQLSPVTRGSVRAAIAKARG